MTLEKTLNNLRYYNERSLFKWEIWFFDRYGVKPFEKRISDFYYMTELFNFRKYLNEENKQYYNIITYEEYLKNKNDLRKNFK